MFTYPYATLSNYQNTFMHKCELRANLTLITYANKNHTWDSVVLESIPLNKDMKWSCRKSHKLRVFHLMTQTLILTYFQKRWKVGWRLWLSLSLSRGGRRLSWKIYGNLNLKEVFIGFPIGLKWLEPTKGLGHLI